MTFVHSAIALTMVVTSLSRADEVSFDGVRERIRRRMADQNVPSIVVAVSRGDKVLWAEALGWADRENRVRATVDTPYRIGSTTKPVTATAVLLLAERGTLDLDRPVNDYLGDVKVEAYIGDPARATVRAVLQHTSGLPGHWETFFPDEPERPPPIGMLVARYGKLMIPPGERFHYSNIGYAVLGDIVTRRSGKEFADFLREEVFLPLGMTRSFLAVGDTRVIDCAVGYRADSTRVPNISTCVPGAGDIYASANDLLRFGMLHLKGRVAGHKPVLSNASIDEMQRRAVPMGTEQYGLGWHIRTDAGGRRHVLHGGAHVGFECHFDLIPEEKLCVVVLANKDTRWPGYRVCLEVADAVFAAVLQVPIEDVQPKGGHILGFPSKETPGLPGKLAGKWRGAVHTYKRNLPVTLWFQEDGDVHSRLDDQLVALVNDARFQDGTFTGKMAGDIGTEDANRRSSHLDWELTLRDGELKGILYATGKDPFGPAPGRGLYLAHWTRLEREVEKKE